MHFAVHVVFLEALAHDKQGIHDLACASSLLVAVTDSCVSDPFAVTGEKTAVVGYGDAIFAKSKRDVLFIGGILKACI